MTGICYQHLQIIGQILLSWRDRLGNFHPLGMLGSNNCNWNNLQWQSDFGFILNKSLLQITGIRYGPLDVHYVEMFNITMSEELKVTVGPLECHVPRKQAYNLTADVQRLHHHVDNLENMFQTMINNTNDEFGDIIEWKKNITVERVNLTNQGKNDTPGNTFIKG